MLHIVTIEINCDYFIGCLSLDRNQDICLKTKVFTTEQTIFIFTAMREIYVSYSPLDHSLVQEIIQDYHREMFFIPVLDIPLGSKWSSSVLQAINDASVILIIGSPNYESSQLASSEFNILRNKRIIFYCTEAYVNTPQKIISNGAIIVKDNKELSDALNKLMVKYITPPYHVNYTCNGGIAPKTPLYSYRPFINFGLQSFKEKLISRLFNPKEPANSAIYAPGEIKKDEQMMVQVYIYKRSESYDVIQKAGIIDPSATLRNYEALHISLKRGDIIKVTYDNEFYKANKTLTWNGSLSSVNFIFRVNISYSFYSMVRIYINEQPAGEMAFRTTVTEQPKKINAAVNSIKYDRIFISYAHSDAKRIKYIAEAYKASGILHFYDRTSLQPGDKFQDIIFEQIDKARLFILCWSKNSSQSEWCCLEKERALYKAKRDREFRIYPISIDPKTALPTDMNREYHFGEI